ncbi:MAG: hypothetical protein H8E44_40585 [Planctomycetes bacterium]|nr:hypothetical protein [Planctomycetota bacterium]MBL7039622.1 hypothetical protein [Pirellulaceae bacterium]
MRAKTTTVICVALIAMAIGASSVWAAKQPAVQEMELNAAGQKLLARYSDQLQALQTEIEKALPKVDEKQKAAFLKAYQDEAAAMAAELNALRAQDRKPAGHPSKKNYETAKEALAFAATKAQPPAKAMLTDLEEFLASNKRDAKLAKYMVLAEATPRGLAEFAQQGKEQETLVETLLADADLMKQMAIADGAKDGKYGQTMQIYTDIQKASGKSKDGTLQRLALAVGLEHAVPVKQTNPAAQTDAPATVDPVNRYLHFEKAYLDGELDPGFKNLSVWDYRLVVNGDETDDILAWGREMLRNYRPDHISTSDYRWRYVEAVKTDVKYGSQDNKYDRPELHKYQNIIMNGGVCGRRAFFGRFILRAFGVPTTARPQRGHAALVHWTPDGWVVCLGASWTWGWTSFGQDRDFLAHTQARMTGKPFEQVRRAQLVGTALGEQRAFGFHAGASGFWNGVALYRQRAIVEEAKAVALAAVGEDIGEANESKVKEAIEAATITEEDRKIVVGNDGVITIPAAACSKPTNSTAKIVFMKSCLGGMQLHYNRNGEHEEFEYTFDVPAAGKYALSARVVTPSWKQHLLVAANGAKEPTDIALPFTVGVWDKTAPVEVALVKGRNVLRFSREGSVKGLTIEEFTLKPLN